MIEQLVRPSIFALKPYSSARDEFQGEASVFLDANENSFGSPLSQNFNRYPDPLQVELKSKLSLIKGLPTPNIFLGNGSDEAIDILFRVFCEPGKDNAIICPPTYGMYEVSANINNVSVKSIPLLPTFELDVEAVLEAQDANSKLLFLCSPNNPTGNSLHLDDMELLIQKFNGVVVIDEAYINFSKQKSCIRWLTEYENLVVLQTFSKAWGLAALRLGMAFSNELIIGWMNKVKPPYNINAASQQYALKALENIAWVNDTIRHTVALRTVLIEKLHALSMVENVFRTDANFVLAKVSEAKGVYSYLVSKGIVVRDRSNVTLCEGCLRITVGTEEENETLIAALINFQSTK
jgi:histidinol-phosphate aminotransferase